MSTIIGIDPSARSTGISIIDSTGEIIKITSIQPPRKLGEIERLHYIRKALDTLLVQHTPQHAAMENYSYGSLHRAFTLAEVAGVIKVTLYEHNVKVLLVAPTQVKKFATGQAHADKALLQKSVRISTNNSDEVDAFVLSKIGCAFFLNQNTQVRHQREVLLALQTSKIE